MPKLYSVLHTALYADSAGNLRTQKPTPTPWIYTCQISFCCQMFRSVDAFLPMKSENNLEGLGKIFFALLFKRDLRLELS